MDAPQTFLYTVPAPFKKISLNGNLDTQSSGLSLLSCPAHSSVEYAHWTSESKVPTGIVEFPAVCKTQLFGLDYWKW